jgi:hypothetical protein
MAILKVQPNAIDTTGNFAVGAVTTTGNVTVGGQLIVNNTILPTSANVIDIGSPTMRFGALYLAGNTIDIGGTLITTDSGGQLSFTTESGNIAITANTVSFLSTVANTVSEAGSFAFDGNVNATAVYSDSYFYANGTPFTGARGYSGSAGTNGYVGSRGDTGLGFTIAKSYSSVAALTADTSPAGIVAGQFALIETGSVNDADNSKLYLWTGSAYSYVNDLSGAAGITGPAGYTGSASTVAGYTGSAGSAGSAGTTGYTGSSGRSTATTGSTAPVSPSIGDFWYYTPTDTILNYANVGVTNAWVDISGPVTNFGTSAATLAAIGASLPQTGQVEYTTAGTYSWIAPAGITSVCVVCVGGGGAGFSSSTNSQQATGGGGGLGWKNNISVTPGQSYTVVVGSGGSQAYLGGPTTNAQDSYFIAVNNNAYATGKGGVSATSGNGGTGGVYYGDGGGNGGNGSNNISGSNNSVGGGGAGGYSGNGANGRNSGGGPGFAAPAGSGAGGSGGTNGNGGGGVGILGRGADGNEYAGGGSGGGGGGFYGSSGAYGGGGSNHYNQFFAGPAGGAVRIIWGPGRAFPSTLTTDQ